MAISMIWETSNATAAWAAKLGMNLQTSTLKFDETGSINLTDIF
jgi:hypothetical protein